MSIALGFQYITSMKNLDSQCDCNSEKTTTIASCRMNGAWTNNNFLLGSIFFVGSIRFIARVIDRGGLGVKRLIKSNITLFVCWKKLLKDSNVRAGEISFFLIIKQTWNVTIK